MPKKIFNTILVCFILNLTLIQLNYAMGTTQAIEKTETTAADQVNQFDINKISAPRAYYIQNPWDFVEKKLVIDRRRDDDAAAGACLGIFLATSIISGGAVALSIAAKEAQSSQHFSDLTIGLIVVFSIVSGFVVGAISAIALYNYLISMRYKQLISILKSYNPDLNRLGLKNTKLCIPREFHLVFDVLWNVYKKQGEDALKMEWDKVEKLITKQIFLKIANPDFKVKFVDDVNLRVVK